jgi:hypothetical protein
MSGQDLVSAILTGLSKIVDRVSSLSVKNGSND